MRRFSEGDKIPILAESDSSLHTEGYKALAAEDLFDHEIHTSSSWLAEYRLQKMSTASHRCRSRLGSR